MESFKFSKIKFRFQLAEILIWDNIKLIQKCNLIINKIAVDIKCVSPKPWLKLGSALSNTMS